MTHGEFIERIEGAVDTAVATLTSIAPIGRMAWLGQFETRVAHQWRQVFNGILTREDVDSMVEDVVATIQCRLDEVEAETLH